MSSSNRKKYIHIRDGHTYSYTLDQNLQNIESPWIDDQAYLPEPSSRKGAYGCVTIFKNAKNEKIAIKTPLDLVYDVNNHRAKQHKEIRLLQKANPQEGHFALFTHDRYDSKNGVNRFAYIMFMPYFPDLNLDEAMDQASSESMIIAYLIAAAMAVDDLHHVAGIIHNDLKANNLRLELKNNKVRALDFYHASEIKAEEKAGMGKTDPRKGADHVDPRIRSDFPGDRIATSESDVFSFGAMLRQFLRTTTRWFPSEEKGIYTPQTNFYPGYIWKFQDMARSGDPAKRPTLKTFRETLEKIALQPLSYKIQFAFTKSCTSPYINLKIGGRFYSPIRMHPGNSGSITSAYQTPLGKLRIKFQTRDKLDSNAIDNMAYTATLEPEEIEDLNRMHQIKHHPDFQPAWSHRFFSLTRYREGICFNEYMKQFSKQSALKQTRFLLALFHKIAEIHQKGYVIGNLKHLNIIIDDPSEHCLPTIKINNLNWTGRLDATYAKTIDCEKIAPHWHPHRRKYGLIAPLTVHDYFSLGYLLETYLRDIKADQVQLLMTNFCFKIKTDLLDIEIVCLVVEGLKEAEQNLDQVPLDTVFLSTFMNI